MLAVLAVPVRRVAERASVVRSTWGPRAATAMAVISVGATVASVVLYFLNRADLPHPPNYLFGDAAAGLIYPVAGALLVRRRADVPVGWVFVATSVLGLDAFCNQYAVMAYLVHPGALPLGGLAAWIATWGWTPALAVPTLVPLLFPHGAPRTRRWRSYLWVVVGVLLITTLAGMFTPAPIDATPKIKNPLGTVRAVAVVLPVGAVLCLFVFTPIAVASLLVRQRRAGPVERAQLSWLSLAAVVTLVATVATLPAPGVWSEIAWTVAVAALPAGVLIGVLRHRLLDIEVVLNRSVAYVLLSAAVLGAYVAAVTEVGAVGQRVGVVAVAALVLVLASARQRVQRWVERALYGARADPYAVVGRVGERLDLARGPVDALQSLADEVREALRLPYVAVRPANSTVAAVSSGHAVAGVTEIPVSVLGDTVAHLVVGLRHRGERLRAEDITLLTDVARRAGALVQAATLITDLQESRERLVSAREEERRRLRRDLHDGVGPELAGMALQLESLAHRSQTDPELADRARRLRDRMRSTVTEVRRLVDDLRPPALDELGLSGALREHFTVYDGVDVVVEQGAPLSHLPAATEVAAYRIASEAVANAVRHGRATSCRVCVAPGDDGLLVEVRDDGCGISADARPGVGLSSMRERATEIGGRFELTTGSEGTTVRAVLPLDAT